MMDITFRVSGRVGAGVGAYPCCREGEAWGCPAERNVS